VNDPIDIKVAAVPGVGHIVPSRSQPGVFWLVYGNRCTCPATSVSCWHKRRVHEHVREIEHAKYPEYYAQLEAERSAPVNTAWFE
jgi:hypothetical protein